MTASERIDKQIASNADWRGELMKKLRNLIHESGPELAEAWKWETGVWTSHGLVCALSAFKDHVKLNFFRGAALQDRHRLFNAGLESKRNRAIDFSEGDNIKEQEIKYLIRGAIDQNNTISM